MTLETVPASEIHASFAGDDLEAEFLALTQRDPEILDFISARCLDGIWYWDLEDPDRGWISPHFWEVLGYDPATRAPSRSSWLDVLHPEDRAAAQRNYDKLIADPDHPFDQIFRYFRADGSIAWMRCRGMALRREDGRPTRMLGVHMDVTALKLAEHDLQVKAQALRGAASELARREEELQFIFDNLPLRIWFKDERNRILHLNAPARSAMAAGALDHGSDEDELEEDAEVIASWTAVSEISEQSEPRTGRQKWVRTDKIPYFDKSLGRRALLIVETDLPRPPEAQGDSGRDKAERELWRRYYTDLYCRLPAIMHSVGSDGRLTEVSDQWLARTGFSREEVIGRDASRFVLRHPALGGQGMPHPLAGHGGMTAALPGRLVRKEGEPLAVELSSFTAIHPQTGTASELVVAADVSERDEAFREIARLTGMLDALHDRMDRSIRLAAGQVGEPLRQLRTEAARLLADGREEDRAPAAAIGSAAGRIAGLIDRLLTYSTVLNRPMQAAKLDLHGLILSVIARLKPELDAAGGRIVVGPCPAIRGDRDMVEEMIRQLLANAISFRAKDRPLQIQIACSPCRGASSTLCTIRDNGAGFDPDMAMRMFEPFAAGGLGLAVCKAICERHGWAIWAEPAAGHGAVITIRFPDKPALRHD